MSIESDEVLKKSERQRQFGVELRELRMRKKEQAGTWAIMLNWEPINYVGLEAGEFPVPAKKQLNGWFKTLNIHEDDRNKLLMLAGYLPEISGPELTPQLVSEAVHEFVPISGQERFSFIDTLRTLVKIWREKRKFR